MPSRVTGRDWLALAQETARLSRVADWWHPKPAATLGLDIWAGALIRTTPGERWCRVCGSLTHAVAEWRCKRPADCPAETLWPEHRHTDGDDPCFRVICQCECTACGGDGWTESVDPLWDGDDMAECGACRGTGERRRQTVF